MHQLPKRSGGRDWKALEFPDINDGWEEYRAVCHETGLEVSRKTIRIWQAALAYARQPQSAAIEAPTAAQSTEECPKCHSRERTKLNEACQFKAGQPIYFKQWHPWHYGAAQSEAGPTKPAVET